MGNRTLTTTLRDRVRRVAVTLMVCGSLAAMPSASFAEGELTGVIGGMLGGDLNNILRGDISIEGAFDNGPLYGGRLGWVSRFFGIEGSFVASSSGISLTLPGIEEGINGSVYFAEGSVLVIPIPGPISPFFTAGAGWHSYSFDDADERIEKFGWTWGGGLKINIKALTIRADIRDHVTPLDSDDFDISPIGAELLEDQRIHNVEISAGIGFRF